MALQLPLDATKAPVALDTDEYGNPRAGQAAVRYNWLGAKQRSTETLTGLTLMGVRLYNPTTGRFLSMDPVHGGGDNRYGYPGDPVNQYDLDGKRWRWGWKKRSYRSYGYSYRSRYASYRCGAGVRFCAPRNAARNRKRNWAFTKRRVRGVFLWGARGGGLGLVAGSAGGCFVAGTFTGGIGCPAGAVVGGGWGSVGGVLIGGGYGFFRGSNTWW
ncbi:hypothetical protein LUX00_19470 [Streptomyces sudanensis]|nr:RHS repeat-associated core domain-containing protein [Streptomyces sudanensis]MCQ0002537.1 hypothetical protein [Streptomyces sudanensis]